MGTNVQLLNQTRHILKILRKRDPMVANMYALVMWLGLVMLLKPAGWLLLPVALVFWCLARALSELLVIKRAEQRLIDRLLVGAEPTVLEDEYQSTALELKPAERREKLLL